MTIPEILAGKVAFQRMHPDNILQTEMVRPRGSARDRRRNRRRLLLQHPEPEVQLVGLGEINGRPNIVIPPFAAAV